MHAARDCICIVRVSVQGCDASILIDPMSNQASEKEAGPNISVKGYDVIEEIKTELEKECPNVVSCADIISVSARDSVKLSGGPEYAVLLGRRDSLVSNREDADNLPGPDIAVPKLIDEFDKQGFNTEEMIAMLGGGHSIGVCRCFFIETDAAPIDEAFKKKISDACDGKDSGSVPMDSTSPNDMDGSYFGLVLEKKMPLTIDRLLGMDKTTEPIVKAMSDKTTDFVPIFAKAMEKLSALKVLTGKDGEIRKTCSEFNNPQNTSGSTSVIRISSIDADQMAGLSQPGSTSRKVGGRADVSTPAAVETPAMAATEAAAKVPGGVVVSAGDQDRSGSGPKLRGSGGPVVNPVPAAPGGAEEAAKQQEVTDLEEKKKRNMAKLRGAGQAKQ
jgi:peroxidase